MHFTENPLFLYALYWKTPFFDAMCHRKTPTSEVLGGTRTSLPPGLCPWTPPVALERAPGPHAVRRGVLHWKTRYFCTLCHWKTPFFDAMCHRKTPTSEVPLVRHFHMWVPPRDPGPPIDIEYNKRLDRQRPCLEDDFNGGCNDIVQSNKSVWRRW